MKRIFEVLDWLVLSLGGIGVGMLVCIVVWVVFLCYVFGVMLCWLEELLCMILVWVIFFGVILGFVWGFYF